VPTDRPQSSLSSADLGARVIIRYRLHDGTSRASDVIGELVDFRDDVAVVRPQRSPEDLLHVSWADVLAAKRIPKRRVTRREVRRVEAAAAGGWVADETGWVGPPGGWLLRAAAGFTSRANSCLPLGSPGQPLDQAVDEVIAWYRARGLPPVFALPTLLGSGLGEYLDARGWPAPSEEVLVLTGTTDDVAEVAEIAEASLVHPGVRIEPEPDERWLAGYRYRGEPAPPGANRVLRRGDRLAFAAVDDDSGHLIAMGRCSVSRDPDGGLWAGITAVEVAPTRRRQGLGQAVVVALIRWAREAGATMTYLQVAESNTAARSAYERLGFSEHHRYSYRRLG